MTEPLGVTEATGPVRPGNVLVFRVSSDIQSRDQFDRLVDMTRPELEARMPGVEFVFVAGIDEIVHYRPGIPA